MNLRPFALALLAGLPLALPAQAVQQAKSRYSTVELSKCRATGQQAWLCRGLPGFPLYVATGSARTYLSAGPKPEVRRAAKQSLGAPNSLFDGRSPRSAIEWRFVIRDKQTVPYATIVRYFTRDRGMRGEVVIVSRVAEGESCQVARIDALANDNPMVLAREIADREARKFDCQQEPSIVGATGRSPM